MEHAEVIKTLKDLIAENEQLSFLSPNSSTYYERISALCVAVIALEKQEGKESENNNFK